MHLQNISLANLRGPDGISAGNQSSSGQRSTEFGRELDGNRTMKASLFISLCVFMCGCDVHVNKERSAAKADDPSMAVSTKTHLYCVQWGYRVDDLAYVSIVGQRLPREKVSGLVTGAISGSRRDFYVHRPDGSKVAVPGAVQLFELIDGHYKQSTKSVSLAEFTAFMESRPGEYSIAALVHFAENRRRAK